MNHKEEMQYLKENDPITHSEITGNPTGADRETFFGCFLFFAVVVFILIGGIVILICKS